MPRRIKGGVIHSVPTANGGVPGEKPARAIAPAFGTPPDSWANDRFETARWRETTESASA